jgi:23S rRNA (pseudouridine1915-N3)-methyltransferase
VRLTILAVGSKMPAWVTEGFAEYLKRFPPEIKLQLKEISMAPRGKDNNAKQCMRREAESIRKALPERDTLIALDVRGSSWSTEQLAGKLADWQMSGDNVSLLIGGPDGIDTDLLQQSQLRWSLSPLTLPHPLVRVVLIEQLYRAWTINTNHPYHRR